jgi:hypothetical protein
VIVGVAEIMVIANTAGFKKELEDSTAPAFAGMRKDAETAGEDAGAGLRTGVAKESGKIERDLGDVGSASGLALRDGVKDGAHGLESDLADVGSLGGQNLRRGVTNETAKLSEDVAKDGEKAGEGLTRGMGGGLSKLANLISNTGLPLGSLSSGLEKAGKAADEAGEHSSGLAGTLEHLGGVALIGVAGAAAVVGAGAVDMGEKMQSADAAIAAASGSTVASAAKVGDAFLTTAGKSEFSGQAQAKAFAGVAGQLKSTEGHALDAGQAMSVMTAAGDLATAKQIDLGDATSTVAGVMQAFQLKTRDAAHVSDVLYTASSATGQSVDALGGSLEKVRSKLGDTAGSVGDLAGLLVDMTDQGITGRAAMSGLNSGMNTLQKTSTGVITATNDQKAAFDQMSPSLQKLADAYRSGKMSSADFTKATDALPPAQAALAKSFATASTAVQTAQLKYKEMGVTAFDASGKFVGMGSIIDQLHPKFADMSVQQQLAAASTLFGAGAARQMVAVIDAGPAAYDAATSSVNKMGAAHAAAAKQSHTLHVEEATLAAEGEDLAAKIGSVLIPIITTFVGALVSATTFVTSHKAALIALAAVVTGILGPAIAVFAVNKMASFGSSFITAGGHVKDFASGVQTAVTKVMGLFTQQSTAAQASADKIKAANLEAGDSETTQASTTETATTSIEGSETAQTTAVSTAAGTIETENAAAGLSFTDVGTKAGAGETAVGTAVAGEVTEVTAADGTIETENAAAGASFAEVGTEAAAGEAAAGTAAAAGAEGAGALAGAAGLLGPVAIVGAGGYLLAKSGAGGPLKQGEAPVGNSVGTNAGGRAAGLGGGYDGSVYDRGKETTHVLTHGLAKFPKTAADAAKANTDLAASSSKLKSSMDMASDAVSAHAAGLAKFRKTGPMKLTESNADATADDGANTNVASNQALTPDQIRAVAYAAGFRGASLNTAVKVAEAESSGVAGPADRYHPGAQEDSRGLWQENVAASANPQYANTNLYNPLTAAKVAYAQSDHGTNWNPWTTFTSGKYLTEPAGSGTPAAAAASTGTPAAVTKMLALAESLIGAPYSKANHAAAFTETSAQIKQFGIDCSGLVSVLLGPKGAGVLSSAQTTQGLPGYLTPGKGQDVTVYDRHTGATDQEHTLIDIMGKYFESGGNPQYNPGGRVRQLTSAQAQGELAGGGFEAFHPTIAGAGATATVAETAAIKLASAREKLAVTIAAETAAVSKQVTKLGAGTFAGLSTTGQGRATGPSLVNASAIAVLRAGLAVEVAQQKAAVNGQTAAAKGELSKQTADAKAATSALGTMLTAVHSKSMTTLAGAVDRAHATALAKIEAALDKDHSTALSALSAQLVKVHAAAMDKLDQDMEKAGQATRDAQDARKVATITAGQAATAAAATAAAAAATTAQIAGLDLGAKLAADQAKATSDQIADSTKVALDQQAAAGLSGTALVAAQAQTALDQVTQSSDRALDAAQAGVDQASGGSALAQSQAAAGLAQAQASATVAAAQAQSTVDRASAAANAASTTSTAAGATFNFEINGANMTASALMSEVGWSLKTGSLPVGVAAPV